MKAYDMHMVCVYVDIYVRLAGNHIHNIHNIIEITFGLKMFINALMATARDATASTTATATVSNRSGIARLHATQPCRDAGLSQKCSVKMIVIIIIIYYYILQR